MQSATQLQATAEDLFVSMCEIDYETGEQYIVDEGSKLLMMCSHLLFQDLKEGTYENIRRLRNFLKRRHRTDGLSPEPTQQSRLSSALSS